MQIILTQTQTDDAALLHVTFNCGHLKMTAPKHGCLILLNACRLSCSFAQGEERNVGLENVKNESVAAVCVHRVHKDVVKFMFKH